MLDLKVISNKSQYNKESLQQLANDEGFILLMDKEYGISSFKAIYTARNILQIKKCGHAGTLDPLATGLLIVGFGRKATKHLDYFQSLQKRYLAEIKLGCTTKSYDAESDEENHTDISNIRLNEIELCKEKFVGELKQTPPIYSAKKVKGKRLYKYAQQNLTPLIKESTVNVYSYEIESYEAPYIKADIKCSKGTYIRSLARDMGECLGIGAYLSNLIRTEIGDYKSEDGIKLSDLKSQFGMP